MLHFRDEWSIRVLDSRGHVFFEALSSNPPASWLVSTESLLPTDRTLEKTHIFARMALSREMAHAILNTEGPDGALQKPWRLLQHYMRVSFAPPAPTVQVSKLQRRSARVLLRHSAMVPVPAANIDPNEESGTAANNAYSGEALLDDLQPHEDLSQGVSLATSLSMGLANSPLAIAGSDSLSLSSLTPTHVTRPMLYPAEIAAVPGKEFQQDVDLYWRPSRSFFQGADTKKHHTAACIKLKQRDLGSRGPWEDVKEICTTNHGFQAGSEHMTRYARCRHLPITKEYFAWKGECSSGYPKHFCNDDTALQLWHAHGEWDGGKHCATTYRTRRPWCEKPW